MATVRGPQKGGEAELTISQEAENRFFVGLGWDPKDMPDTSVKFPKKPKSGGGLLLYYLLWPIHFVRIFFVSLIKLVAVDMYTRNTSKNEDKPQRDDKSRTFDLDLGCYVFDAALQFKGYVGPEGDAFIDASKKIYHSGEDQSGFGGPDDEAVSVETKGMPDDYQHFFFVVKSDSQYGFQDVRNPSIRLADGKLNENILESTITPPVHYNASGFVFCHVWREGAGWRFRNLDEYTNADIDWQSFLPGLIKKAAA
jgi:stress response protein SCP2